MKLSPSFRRSLVTAALSTGGLLFVAPAAQAGFIATYNGNDCSGVFGQGFENCAIPSGVDPNKSPIIIKFDADKGYSEDGINSIYPSIDGKEFSFFVTDSTTGSWTYTPGANDPVINFYVVKYGNFFDLYSTDGNKLSGSWDNGEGTANQGVSHISFYNGGKANECTPPDCPGPLPEPESLALLGAGILGFALTRRRRHG